MGTVSIRKYGWVAVLGLLMAVALVVFLLTYHVPSISQLTFTERVQGMDIEPFHDEVDDVYYLFLPAYVSKEQVDITMPEDASIHFSANGQDYGSSLARLPLQEPVELSISSPYHQSEKYIIELLQSKNLPTLFIETGEGGAESVLLNKSNKAQAAVVEVRTDGKVDYKGMGKLYGRGNSTWNQAKRPYNLKFNQLVSLNAGADSATNWCLLANYGDDSQIRNIICNYVARKVGVPYTSKMVFASLYINGEYQGLYNIATKQGYMADADSKLKAVFEKSDVSRIYDKVSDKGFYIRTRYGNAETVVNSVNSFERILYSDTASYQQLGQYIDLHSLACKCFIDMVCANLDVWLSQYYMLDDKERISPMCAWDYDLSYGLTWYYPDFGYNQIMSGQPWYNALFEHNEFREELSNLLTQYSNLLHEDILAYEDNICQTIESDWLLNSRRWKDFAPFADGYARLKSKDYDFNTLQGHKAYIDSFRIKRLQFLEDYWKTPELYHQINFTKVRDDGKKLSITLRWLQGDTLKEDKLPDGLLTMPDEGFIGWYTQDGTSIADVGVMTQDMSFNECSVPKSRVTLLLEKITHNEWPLILLSISVLGCLFLWLFIKIPIKEARG